MQGARFIDWKGRDGVLITNGVSRLIALNGGGHIAHFGFGSLAGATSPNALWEAEWQTIDPGAGAPNGLPEAYGSPDVQKYLAGFTGHSLCLDYFGAASTEQAAAGLSLHGEAASSVWKAAIEEPDRAKCVWALELPHAGLSFERGIELKPAESVAFISECVRNARDVVHHFDWVQHVTLGEPLLAKGCSRVFASARKGVSSPDAYGTDSRILLDQEMHWPFAPDPTGEQPVDLREPFAEDGKGFIAGFEFDPSERVGFIVAVNWEMQMGIGYCFARERFPLMTVWEENRSRQERPWQGRSRARGMEFGTTWLPRNAEGYRGRAIEGANVPPPLQPGEMRAASYVSFLFTPSPTMRNVDAVAVHRDEVVVSDSQSGTSVSVPAAGVGEFLK